ncbi:MAG: translation elongation factor G [Candidatus Glassbacteria bacterium RIFCSPLOWO2_12_FULL_58_11]|uniref:Elongation factor G n=1 Tax=Candidatus Glassbacteria bacterium RIFCSPLOWO2_12_FULL_58_11 TaxID=1817867 RepID=A0A1F5YYQ1_9BACT|nr:MAG: translation elongation factor G [Candidatus Glassbacteria bacterium RIFCSPLOWO2_12_FULL_58_11]
MKKYESKDIRNVAVVGHASCGKTTLTGALCFAAGSSKRLGSVAEGNSLTDYSQDEIERKISINLGIAFAEWERAKINLVDAPGYLDFSGDAYAALRGTDSALLVVHASSGVEIGTELMWRTAAEHKMPVAVFINMMDKEHADFQKVLEQLRKSFEGHFVPLTLPVGEGEHFRGVVDLTTNKACLGVKDTLKGEYTQEDVPADMKAEVDQAHKEFIEFVAELDESLMERYFADEKLSAEEIAAALQRGVRNREIFPVFCGSAANTYGMQQLLNGLVNVLPDPTMFPPLKANPVGKEAGVEVQRSSGGPLVALVYKTITEPHVGDLSFFRLFSGVLKNGDEVLNANGGHIERLGHLSIMQGRDRFEIEELMAGDIGVVAKLKHTHTGNTLSTKAVPVVLPEIDFPKPVINVAIEPKTRGDEDKISTGLKKLQEEDQTFHSYFDGTLHQMIVWGMGELHLEVILHKLKRKFNVDAEYAKPRIAYKETIRSSSEGQGKYKKQSGGRGQYGDCWIRLMPLERGGGIEFVDKIVGGAIPGRFIPGVEKGVREAAGKGVLAGYPVEDFRAECFDGSYHTVDSSDVAFQVAGSMAFQKVVMQSTPILLEPILNVEVIVPEEYMGDVIGDLNSRRGRIQGMTTQGHFQKVTAQVPQAELYKYSTSLRSITQGRGVFKSDFSHYEEVPRDQVEKIIQEFKKEKEKA